MFKIKPLAFESLGVRSMATFIETNDLKAVIDPGVALAPNRFGLKPHPLEEEAKETLWRRIREHVEKSDVVIISHYHFDHFNPDEPDIFEGKTVFLKESKTWINLNQKARARDFQKELKRLNVKSTYIDGKTFKWSETEIKFSHPVPHGSSNERGYVVEVCVRAEKTFIHTSDLQGPLLQEQVDFILREEPDFLIVDGPSTYLSSPYQPIELKAAVENLNKIIRETKVVRMILDHHLTRDIDYKQKIEPVYETAETEGSWVGCAAEFLGEKPRLLEADRRRLYSES
ncbi:MAG: MBL fold metallo-hydrolase [Candidatus Bathyarchaeia archaeon]